MSRRKRLECTDEQYKAALESLADGGTKKAACEILGIAYNTKRLDNLLTDWIDDQERRKRLRAEKRKTAVSPEELKNMIQDYLDGYTWDELSRSYYRSVGIIKYKLEQAGALIRVNHTVYPLNPPMMPDQCMADEFKPKERVWVPGYQCLGEIRAQVRGGYSVILLHPDKYRNIALPAYEIGKLDHLRDLGVDVDRLGVTLSADAVKQLLYDAIKAANKNKATR